MNAEVLLKHFDRISDAPGAVSQLRRFVLDLAVRGKLVEQFPSDEPAWLLLQQIQRQKDAAEEQSNSRVRLWTAIEEAEHPYQLPDSWSWSRLASVSLGIQYGYTASADPSNTAVRLLRITDIQDNSVDWNTVPGCQIPPEDVARYALHRSDILIARTGGTIGKSYLVTDTPVAAVFASYLIRVRPMELLHDRYVKLFFESTTYWSQLQEGTRGTGQPNVNGQTLGSLLFPVPPLPEQHRIVQKADELMALCDQLEEARKESSAKRNALTGASHKQLLSDDGELRSNASFFVNKLPTLTARPEQIGLLRQTVLNLAMRGMLVPQDPTDEPVDILIERIRLVQESQEKRTAKYSPMSGESGQRTPFEIPKGWRWVQVQSFASLVTKGSSPKWQGVQYVAPENGVLFITSENVGNYNLRKLDELKYVESRFNEIEPRSVLRTGDILMNLVGASIGRTAVFDLEVVANINQAVALIRLVNVEPGVSPQFLLQYFNSPAAVGLMLGSRVTTAQPNISLTDVRELPVPLPPHREQQRIVARVNQVMALCDRLQSELVSTGLLSDRLLTAVLAGALSDHFSRGDHQTFSPGGEELAPTLR